MHHHICSADERSHSLHAPEYPYSCTYIEYTRSRTATSTGCRCRTLIRPCRLALRHYLPVSTKGQSMDGGQLPRYDLRIPATALLRSPSFLLFSFQPSISMDGQRPRKNAEASKGEKTKGERWVDDSLPPACLLPRSLPPSLPPCSAKKLMNQMRRPQVITKNEAFEAQTAVALSQKSRKALCVGLFSGPFWDCLESVARVVSNGVQTKTTRARL